ncbi:PREDICTED: TMF-regulated nuclear protein 1 [Calidris pugnax]|uniref:TMF-regulated nuclear protein 1 n=1 Tax=Calidris pugnax TaxID=198806 RepID=UPI00071DD253|nr:PREDICTED: TMF-regulated nuclear protein 1 [Calidris pugnax]
MAAAVAAEDRCPAAGDEQRPDGGGTTSTTGNTGGGGTGNNGNGGTGNNGGTGSSSSPGSVELAAARRRLVAAEGRRRAAAELEGRVRQVHCALRHAELRLAARAEALGRLGAGVAQAQLALAAHNQRLQKGLRRRPRPRPAALLAAARALRSCVPWGPARPRGSGTTPAASRRLPADLDNGGTGNNGGTGSSSSPGSVELAAARRRLVAAEGRRRAAAELEGRVRQVHCALRHAELRLAARAEALGRLGAGVAQAQLALAAHNQRLQKGLRRRPRPRPAALLAAARALRSCVPWGPARPRGSGTTPAASRRLPAAPRSPA